MGPFRFRFHILCQCFVFFFHRALGPRDVRMVVLDISLPTGFTPENSDLEMVISLSSSASKIWNKAFMAKKWSKFSFSFLTQSKPEFILHLFYFVLFKPFSVHIVKKLSYKFNFLYCNLSVSHQKAHLSSLVWPLHHLRL